jgi:hypothetical protein
LKGRGLIGVIGEGGIERGGGEGLIIVYLGPVVQRPDSAIQRVVIFSAFLKLAFNL